MELALVKTEVARRAIAEARGIDEIKDIRDKAEAIRLYAKQAHLGIQMQNDCAEIKIRAERKGGELLIEMKERGERHPGGNFEYHDDIQKLDDLGVTPLQSSRWQQMAKIPEADFERRIAETKADEKELTTAGTVRAARATQNETARREASLLPNSKYRVVYADPPWKYGNTMPDEFGEQADHYPLMSLADICALPVRDIVEDDAVLFIWVTSPILEEAFEVIDAWGFEYKASFVWDKMRHVMGHYNSVRHEFLLVCVRGSCQPYIRKLYDSVISEERTEHSRKPETFRNIIDSLYPFGKRIELFARETVDGWDVYGNEVKSSPVSR